MNKNQLIFTTLAIFLLMGITSLTMGATSTGNVTPVMGATLTNIPPVGNFYAYVNSIGAVDSSESGGSGSYANLTLLSNKSQLPDGIGKYEVQIKPGLEEINLYNTLNSAYFNSLNSAHFNSSETYLQIHIEQFGKDRFLTMATPISPNQIPLKSPNQIPLT